MPTPHRGAQRNGTHAAPDMPSIRGAAASLALVAALGIAAGCARDAPSRATVNASDPRLAWHGERLMIAQQPFAGTLRTQRSDGTVLLESYAAGLRHGPALSWYRDGTPETARRYAAGAATGTHRGWWPDGQPRFERRFLRGRASGLARTWHRDGRRFEEHRYLDGQEQGLQRVWDESGALRANYVIRAGRRYGSLGPKPCVDKAPRSSIADLPTADARGGDTGTLPIYTTADLTPVWYSRRDLRAHFGERRIRFTLLDQDARPFSQQDLQGKIVVASFFFTGCSSLCPTLRSAMAQVRERYARDTDVQLVSHSITPELDRPPMLRAYARLNRIDGERWRLLTGDPAEMARVARELYHVRTWLAPSAESSRSTTADAVMHTETLVLMDAQQRVRGIYNGTLAIDVAQLVADIQQLRREG
jgi:protein SCO1